MKVILVALELNKKDETLIAKAMEQAEKFGAKIWLAHIAAPPPDFVGEKAGPQYIRDILGKELREEHRLLQLQAVNLKTKGIDAEALMVQGMTVDTIIEESERLNADLIVIGIYHYSALHRILIGSQASKVVNRSKVPVLVVPVD